MTLSKDISIKDINFNAELIGEYSLNFCVSDNEISHIVYDAKANKLLALEKHSISDKNITSYLENHIYLSGRFWNEINICFTSNQFSLIPNSLFDSSMIENYLQLNGIKNTGMAYGSSLLTPSRITNCFAYKKDTLDTFTSFYKKNIKVTHHTTAFIRCLNNFNLPNEVHLLFQGNTLSIAIKKEGNIKYVNVFEPKTSDDSIFYTLMIIKKLKLSQNAPIFLYGDINTLSSEYIRLKEFSTHIKFARRITDHRFSFAFDELDDHNFPHLYKIFDAIHYE